MKRVLMLAMLVGSSALGLAGCGGETTKVEDKSTVSTPSGETTRTDTTKIEKSGEAPPAAPAK